MQAEPLRRGLHEGQAAQRLQALVRTFFPQHGGEHAAGDAPRDGGRIQGGARLCIEAGAERPGERVDDLRRGVRVRHLTTGEVCLQREP